jgi:MFS family permease
VAYRCEKFLRTVLRDTFRSRAISPIVLPLIKRSRRIWPIVSTVSIPPHCSLESERAAHQANLQGVNFGRRSPDSGGRALVSSSLMSAQALLFNAIVFNYSLMLSKFFNIPLANLGWYFVPIAAGNFLGPLALGRLFDTFGRKEMIALTYAISGLLIAGSGYLFLIGAVSALTQSLAWMVTFFFASAAASAAYLTAGEIFPLEIRALAIAFFFAIGTGIGGVVGPWWFANLINEGRESLYLGFVVLSAAMTAAALIELIWGVAAERRPLEDVARPLTFIK